VAIIGILVPIMVTVYMSAVDPLALFMQTKNEITLLFLYKDKGYLQCWSMSYNKLRSLPLCKEWRALASHIHSSLWT